MRRGHGVRRARSQRGPQGGQPRGDGPMLGRTAGPRGRSGCLLIAVCVLGRLGRGTPGTSVPSLAGCWRPPPCRRPGLQRALRATPGGPALPLLCSTCLHTGGISLVPSPLAPGGAAPTSGGRPLSLVRRAGWPVEPCVAPARGPGPPYRGLVSQARTRDSGRHRAARLPAATLASAWSRFGGRVCPSIAGRGRIVASGTLWSGPPAGALGRRGVPLPATPPALPPGRCPSAGPEAGGLP